MDHITRCPNCATAFRVTDEQLAACMGKVRCGRCSFTFNARQSLVVQPQQEIQPEQETIPAPVQAQESKLIQPPPKAVTEPAARPIALESPFPDLAMVPTSSEPAIVSTETVSEPETMTSEPFPEEAKSAAIQESEFEPPFPDLVMAPAMPESIATPSELASQPKPVTTERQPAETKLAVTDPVFNEEEIHAPSVADLYAEALKAPPESAAAQEPAMTWATHDKADPNTLVVAAAVQEYESDPPPASTAGTYRPIALPEDEALFAPIEKPRHARIWTFFALLAGLVLAAQMLFAYRVNIAMEFPALQPRLARLCSTLGCDMPLPGKSERLRLEWSELAYIPDHPTLIQLSATLRNLADYEQALPLLELTLTDEQERVVARRVFRPEEYLANTDKTRRSLPSHDELRAFLQLETGKLRSTGYSLYWFYE